jgi:Divergent InlB B-repeat domain
MRAALPLLLATGCITDPTLFVERTGQGTGRVVSDPDAIDCGQICGANIAGGRITLVAEPGTNSYFAGWSGACDDSLEPSCTFDVVDQMRVTADFGLAQQRLEIVPAPGGQVVAPNLECPGTCVAEYPFGTEIKVTAKPDPIYIFAGWTDGSGNAVRIFTMDKNVMLEPIFLGP